jgi:hypothetical protein
VNARGKNSPSDKKGDLLHAAYGYDADNPILWHLINLRNQLQLCRSTEREKSPALALFSRATTLGLNTVHRDFALGFFDAAAKALLRGDAVFFREVARLIEQRIKGHPVERRIDLAVHYAFIELQSRSEGSLPTKKKVRECALKWMAMDKAFERLGPKFVITDVFYWSEGGRAKVKKSLLAQMEKEFDLIPEQNWTKIFKRCGLSHLPNDKGGQPSHSKRRYCRLDD